MKRNKILLLHLLGICLLISFNLYHNNLNFNPANSAIGPEINKNTNYLKRSGHWDLTGTPIFINDFDPNYSWSKTATDNDWCNGSGTWSDPYIIENVTIDGGNSSNCIEIKNSNVYFRIENCTVYNSGSETWSAYAGIKLDHVNNGALLNSNFSNNYYGISLVWSNNNTIYGNTANDNAQYGIQLNTLCNNNSVSGNTANNNQIIGISVCWSSNNNIVSNNTASGNVYGLEISSNSEENLVVDNDFSENSRSGWFSYGIRIFSESNYNFFINNTINNNGRIGIGLFRCRENRIVGNIINLNYMGIFVEESNNNTIVENTISNSSFGIGISQSKCNDILNNTFSDNTIDISGTQDDCVIPPLINPFLNENILIIGIIIGIIIAFTIFLAVMIKRKGRPPRRKVILAEKPIEEIKPKLIIPPEEKKLDIIQEEVVSVPEERPIVEEGIKKVVSAPEEILEEEQILEETVVPPEEILEEEQILEETVVPPEEILEEEQILEETVVPPEEIFEEEEKIVKNLIEVPKIEIINCQFCGKELSSDMIFCLRCGHKLKNETKNL